MKSSVPHFEEIINDSRGLWLSGLFGAIIGWNPDHDFPVYKDMFFTLVKDLLDNNLIRFCRPDDPLGKGDSYWNVDSNTIVKYLRDCWPENAADENDEELNIYFYSVPTVLWSNDSGNYLGS